MKQTSAHHVKSAHSRMASARARQDFLADIDAEQTDLAEELKDRWADLATTRKKGGRRRYLAFMRQHGGAHLNRTERGEVVGWAAWQAVAEPA